MYNLLTEKYKSIVRGEYRQRISYLVFFSVTTTLFILFFSWAPFYYFLNLRLDFVGQNLASLVEQNKNQQDVSLKNSVKNFSNQIVFFKPALKPLPLRSLLLYISDLAPKGVSITGLSWAVGKTGEGTFFVKGVANDRDTMQSFVKMLQSDKTFATVDFSRSQYAKDENAAFSLTLTYKPQ